MTPEIVKARLRSLADADATEIVSPASDYDLNPGHVIPTAPTVSAAVLIGLIAAHGSPQVILTRRADTLARHTGQVALPGGRLDPGETPVQAALREAWEEVGLDPDLVRPLGLAGSYRTVTDYLITPVVGWIDRAPRLTPAPQEVADVFTVPLDHLLDPANHVRGHHDVDGERRWFWTIAWGDRVIWGATAGILREFALRLSTLEAVG